MKLTDEQKDEIREAIETQGGIYSEYGLQQIRKNGIEWLQKLLKSEQAWKEEAQMGYENYDRLHGQLSQAIEVLNDIKAETLQARADDRISGGYRDELIYVIESYLSSLSQEGGSHEA